MGKLLFGLVMLTAVGAAQQVQTGPASAFPSGGFTFAGDWKCQGTFRGGKPHESTFTGKTVVGDNWIELSEVDTLPATGYVAKYLIGVDAEHHQLVEFDANNFGAATYSSRDGWVGNGLTMTSSVSDNPSASYAMNRFTYTVAGANSFTIDWQISKTAEPKWTTADHLECKRAG
jgi:hypothetical protein